MNINGYDIKEKITLLTDEIKLVAEQFKDSLWVFKTDNKEDPKELFEKYKTYCEKLTKLNCLQQKYNLNNTITFNEKTISLAEAIKLVSQIDSMKNMWKTAFNDKAEKVNSFFNRTESRQRPSDVEIAERATPVKESLELYKKYSTLSSQLRKLIATANSKEICIGEIGLYSEFSSELFD